MVRSKRLCRPPPSSATEQTASTLRAGLNQASEQPGHEGPLDVLPALVFGTCLVAPLYPGTPGAALACPLPAPLCPSLPGRLEQ